MSKDDYKIWREDCRRRDWSRVRTGMGTSSVPGVYTIEATHMDWPRPIAVVWFRWFGRDGIEIMDSLTHVRFRRCGLRTWLNEALFLQYPHVQLIRTNDATKSGEAWMKSVGYKKVAGGWELRRK